MSTFLNLLVYGLADGAILALAALGFVLIYKATGVINFAQGEFLLVGAYAFYTAFVVLGLPLVAAVAVGVVVATIIGVVVERFILDGQQARLTQASLETLAVIAYRQPISRARVGAVRGVNVDGVVRTLLTRGLITEVGLDAEHGAVLYGTTSFFLQRLGISSLDELPPLAPYLPDIDDVDEPGMTAVGGLSAVMETTGADAPAHPEPVDDEIEQRQQHDDRATREKWE